MIGHEDENQEVHFKVADRRKFNADGSLKEGVTLDPSPQLEAKKELTIAEDIANTQEQDVLPDIEDTSVVDQNAADEMPLDPEDNADFPGADDPASFLNFLSTLATNAAAALGAVPHPATGQRSLDLETGKYWLDVLAMLQDKTKSNLHPKEKQLLEGLLSDLRMQYVHLVKATEERLKSQAAAKFTGDDILGKK